MRLSATKASSVNQYCGLGNQLSDLAGARPSLDLDFANNKTLQDNISTKTDLVTFTRASSGTYVGSDGLIKTATTNEARFDHNPTTGESLGLLVEEQRTNLLLQSESFNTTWTNTGSSESVNVVTAPDGTLSADALVDTAINETHNLTQTVAGLAGSTAYAFSCFMKKGSKNYGVLVFAPNSSWGAGTGASVFFDLNNGTVGTAANATGTIQPFPNGWYRCTATATTVASPGTVTMRIGSSLSGSAQTYTGAGDEALYIWGAQLEAGAFPTSYIPTTTAAVTRSADVASITGSNFSSWYRQDEGTVFAEAKRLLNTGDYSRLISFNNNSSANIFAIYCDNGPRYSLYKKSNNGADNYALGPTLGNFLTNTKTACASDTNSMIVAASGILGAAVNATAMPSNDRLIIGAEWYGAQINGTIRRLTYWPQRLPNATLQEITR